MDEDNDKAERRAWGEWEGWVACVLAAVIPTAILASLVQRIEGKTEPWFVPGLFIGLFSLMVLALRPWSLR